MSNRGATLQNLMRNDDALEVMQQTVTLQREVYGPAHPTTLQTVMNMGMTQYSANRFGRAIPHFEEAYHGLLAAMGPGHGQVSLCRELLAHSLINTKRKAEAAPHQEWVFQRTLATYGLGDGRTAREALRSSACDLEAGRPGAARLTLETVLAAWRDRPNPDAEAEFAGMVHGNLGDAHAALGQLTPAADHWLDAAAHVQAFSPNDAAELAHCRARAAEFLRRSGRVVPALKLLEKAIQLCRERGIRTNESARYVFQYGQTCRDYGDVKAAEHNMKTWVTVAREGASRGIPEALDELRAIAPEMVKLYVAAGRSDEANEWRELKLPREVAPKPVPAK
jgi:tetratricopeptide (TPR) repeat protein